MGDVSAHFSRHEYACKCNKPVEDGYCDGNFDAVDITLNYEHESIRARISYVVGEEVSITLSSGNRCPKHNEDEGGADKSTHKYAKGSDLEIRRKKSGDLVTPELCYSIIDKLLNIELAGRHNIPLASFVEF